MFELVFNVGAVRTIKHIIVKLELNPFLILDYRTTMDKVARAYLHSVILCLPAVVNKF